MIQVAPGPLKSYGISLGKIYTRYGTYAVRSETDSQQNLRNGNECTLKAQPGMEESVI